MIRRYWRIGLLLGLVVWLFWPAGAVRTPMTVSVGSGTIAMDRTHTHFFLAEYDLELVVFRDGKEIKKLPFGSDTGGYSHFDIYQVGDSTLVIVGAFGFSALQLTDGSIQSLGNTKSFEPVGTFLGAFDTVGRGAEREYRFIPAGERPDVRVQPAKGG